MAETVTIKITGEAAQALREFQKAQQGLTGVSDAAQQVGRDLSLRVTVPMLAVGTAATRAFTGFEKAMTGVAKTVDAPEAAIAALGGRFKDLSEEIPTSANELARIGELAGQLGVEAENIEDFTTTIAALGVSTNLSTERAATSLARLSNIMGTSQDDTDRLGSTIVDLGNNLATTEAEITDFALRIAGAGEIAGLTEADVLALGGALSSVGVRAEAGGTAVQRALIQMNTAVAQSNDELQVFAETAGMTVEEFAERFRTEPVQAFTAFIEGLQRAGDDATVILEELFDRNQRLTRAFLALANAGDLLSDAVDRSNTAWRENTALAEEAERFYDRLGAELESLGNKVVNVSGELGGALEPALRGGITVSSDFLDVARLTIDAFEDLDPAVQNTVFAIAAIGTAAGPALVAFSAIHRGLRFVSTGAAAARTALMGLAFTPQGIVVAGLGFVAAALLNARLEAAKTAREVTDAVAEMEEAFRGLENMTVDRAIQGILVGQTELDVARQELAQLEQQAAQERGASIGRMGPVTTGGAVSEETQAALEAARGRVDELESSVAALTNVFQDLQVQQFEALQGIQADTEDATQAMAEARRMAEGIGEGVDAVVRLAGAHSDAREEVKDLQLELQTLLATQASLEPASDAFDAVAEKIADVRQEIEITTASVEGLGRVLGTAARGVVQQFDIDTEIQGQRLPGFLGPVDAGPGVQETIQSVTQALRTLDRQGQLTEGTLSAARGQLAELGRTSEEIDGILGRFDDGMEETGSAARTAEGVVISSFGGMVQAAITGSQDMEQVVISTFTQILQGLSQKGGPLESIFGGFGVPVFGAIGGILGAVFSDRGREPQKVEVDRFGSEAEQTLRDTNPGPETVTVQLLDARGEEISRVQQQIRRREARDASTRIPLGASAPTSGG